MSADDFSRVREVQRAVSEMSLRHHLGLMAAAGISTSIALHEAPEIDEYGTITMGEWKGYLIQVVPMVFNLRIVMTPKSCPMTYDHGWCFDKGPAAFLALAAWDPQRQAEPAGFKKRIGPLRTAGEDADQDMPIGAAAALAIFGVLEGVTDSGRL